MESQFLDPSWRNLNPSGNIINTIYEHKYTKQLCFFPPFDPQHLIQVYMLVKNQYSLDFSFLAQEKQFFQVYQEIKQQETTLGDHLNIRRFGEIMQGAIESTKADGILDGAKLRKYNIMIRGINANYGLAVCNSKIIANEQLKLKKEKSQQEPIVKKIKKENNEICIRKVEVNDRIMRINKSDQMLQEIIKKCQWEVVQIEMKNKTNFILLGMTKLLSSNPHRAIKFTFSKLSSSPNTNFFCKMLIKTDDTLKCFSMGLSSQTKKNGKLELCFQAIKYFCPEAVQQIQREQGNKMITSGKDQEEEEEEEQKNESKELNSIENKELNSIENKELNSIETVIQQEQKVQNLLTPDLSRAKLNFDSRELETQPRFLPTPNTKQESEKTLETRGISKFISEPEQNRKIIDNDDVFNSSRKQIFLDLFSEEHQQQENSIFDPEEIVQKLEQSDEQQQKYQTNLIQFKQGDQPQPENQTNIAQKKQINNNNNDPIVLSSDGDLEEGEQPFSQSNLQDNNNVQKSSSHSVQNKSYGQTNEQVKIKDIQPKQQYQSNQEKPRGKLIVQEEIKQLKALPEIKEHLSAIESYLKQKQFRLPLNNTLVSYFHNNLSYTSKVLKYFVEIIGYFEQVTMSKSFVQDREGNYIVILKTMPIVFESDESPTTLKQKGATMEQAYYLLLLRIVQNKFKMLETVQQVYQHLVKLFESEGNIAPNFFKQNKNVKKNLALVNKVQQNEELKNMFNDIESLFDDYQIESTQQQSCNGEMKKQQKIQSKQKGIKARNNQQADKQQQQYQLQKQSSQLQNEPRIKKKTTTNNEDQEPDYSKLAQNFARIKRNLMEENVKEEYQQNFEYKNNRQGENKQTEKRVKERDYIILD